LLGLVLRAENVVVIGDSVMMHADKLIIGARKGAMRYRIQEGESSNLRFGETIFLDLLLR
jgi:hypothetical protein